MATMTNGEPHYRLFKLSSSRQVIVNVLRTEEKYREGQGFIPTSYYARVVWEQQYGEPWEPYEGFSPTRIFLPEAILENNRVYPPRTSCLPPGWRF